MTRHEPVCIGCLTQIVPGPGAADGGGLCPKCGPRSAEQIVRAPPEEVRQ